MVFCFFGSCPLDYVGSEEVRVLVLSDARGEEREVHTQVELVSQLPYVCSLLWLCELG